MKTKAIAENGKEKVERMELSEIASVVCYLFSKLDKKEISFDEVISFLTGLGIKKDDCYFLIRYFYRLYNLCEVGLIAEDQFKNMVEFEIEFQIIT